MLVYFGLPVDPSILALVDEFDCSFEISDLHLSGPLHGSTPIGIVDDFDSFGLIQQIIDLLIVYLNIRNGDFHVFL
jgi:hypothetical protein